MNIKKPYNFILTKKHPDRYFDLDTGEEFPYNEINKHLNWCKYEYDNNGKQIYYENNDGDWSKTEYNTNENVMYKEWNDGYWKKWKFNNEKLIYSEDSDGYIKDNRR